MPYTQLKFFILYRRRIEIYKKKHYDTPPVKCKQTSRRRIYSFLREYFYRKKHYSDVNQLKMCANFTIEDSGFAEDHLFFENPEENIEIVYETVGIENFKRCK